MVEQLICNQQVAGSSPIASSVENTSLGRVPERSKGTDCKSVATGFEGSNPSPSTAAITTAIKHSQHLKGPFDGSKVGKVGMQVGMMGSMEFAGVAQLVELQPSKLDVAGSRPVSRSNVDNTAHLAQLAEHVLGKDEVTRSIRVVGSQLQIQ